MFLDASGHNAEPNTFCHCSGTRPRPSYALPRHLLEGIEEGFPDKNALPCAKGLVLRYKREKWRPVLAEMRAVETRTLLAGVYLGTTLLAVLDILESRNASNDELDPGDYFYALDAHSESLRRHAEAVIAARNQLQGEETMIEPKEAFFEIRGLFVMPAGKAKSAWQEPLATLIRKKFGPLYSTMVLRAMALEFKHVGVPGQASLNDTMLKTKVRREAALCRLYQKTLNVQSLDGFLPDCHWLARQFSG